MVYITGDCHGDFSKFSNKHFPEQRSLTKDDIVIICGDFSGIWGIQESESEKYWLKWLNSRNFTTVFIDGNHENFQRLNNDFEVIQFHCGKAHRIRDSIYHLMRGEIYEFDDKRFFTFGGASSHDMKDGVLRREDFKNEYLFKDTIRKYRHQHRVFRIKDISWWQEELPNQIELHNANQNLTLSSYEVDYVITHCAPYDVVKQLGIDDNNILTQYLNTLAYRIKFKHWYFGHYHSDVNINDKFTLIYNKFKEIRGINETL